MSDSVQNVVPSQRIPLSSVGRLSPLFQQGVLIDIQTGTSVQALLTEQWGIDAEYVRRRISSVFLNAKPVDDFETAVVAEGAILALSSAMPGLVGAIMRSGGKLAGMRGSITYAGDVDPHLAPKRNGRITLKLFNLLIDELGGMFLKQGLWVTAAALTEVFPERAASSDDHWVHLMAATR